MSFEKETVTPPSYERWVDSETNTVARMDGPMVTIEFASAFGSWVMVPVDAAAAVAAALTALVPSIPPAEQTGTDTLDTTEGVTHG